MKNKNNKKEQFLKELEFEAKEMSRIYGKKSPTFKIIKNIILSILSYFIFLIPYIMLTSSYKKLSYVTYFFITIILFIVFLIKKRKNKDKKEKIFFQNILNGTSISIGYILLFISILTILPNIMSYYAQAYYLSIYEYLSTSVYLTLTCLFMPALETFLLRNLIKKYNNKKLKIFLAIFNSLLVFIIQPHFIYGLFFMLVSLILNIFVLKTNNLTTSFYIQVIFNFIFSISLLYLSSYKLLILIVFAMILLINLIINVYNLALEKNKN